MKAIILVLVFTLVAELLSDPRGRQWYMRGEEKVICNYNATDQNQSLSKCVETNSEQNKCFEYEYDAEVLNTIPGARVDSSGIKLKSKIKVGNINLQEKFLTFQTLEVSEYNGVYPAGRFVHSPKMTKSLEELKDQTVTFQQVRGSIGNIKTDGNISLTVVNLLKGAVGLFSFNVKSKTKTYTVMEDTISGTCNATVYVEPNNHKPDDLFVIRYMDCDDSVAKVVGATYYKPCKLCKGKNKHFLASSVSQYKMKVGPEGFQIMEADVLESRTLTPTNEFGGIVVSQARQKLLYKRSVECSAPETSNMKNHGSLQYMFTNDLPPLPGPMYKEEDCKAQIEKNLNTLIHLPVESLDKKSEIIQELLQAERMCKNYPWNDTLNNANYRDAILPLIPTFKDSTKFKVVRHFIRRRMQHPFTTLKLLLSCLWTSSPTLKSLNEFKHIMEEYVQLPNALGSTTAYLAYASLIGRYCDISSTCSLSHLEDLWALANMIHSSEEERDVLVLKAYANVQNPVVLRTLANFILGCKSSPRRQYFSLRAAAALSKKHLTEEVQLLAYQTVMNQKCTIPSRILAIKILLQSQPSLAICMNVANAMATESNKAVSDFFTSQLETVARRTDPNHHVKTSVASRFCQVFHTNTSQILDLCNKISMPDASKNLHITEMENELLHFTEGHDVIPFGVIFSSGLRVHDEKYNLFEVSVIDFGKGNTQKSYKKMSSHKAAVIQAPVVEGSLTLFGKNLLSGSLEEMQGLDESIKNWFHKQVISATSNMPLVMKASMWEEAHCIVSTCVGFPLVVSITGYSQAELKGNVLLNILPRLKPGFKLSDFKKASVYLQTQLDSRAEINLQFAMGISTPLIQSFLVMNNKMVLKLPTNIAVKGNIWVNRFQLETPACEQKSEIFLARSKTSSIRHCIGDSESAPHHHHEEISTISQEDFQVIFTDQDSGTKWNKSAHSASAHEPLCYDACTFGCKFCIESSLDYDDPHYMMFDDYSISINLQKSHTEAPIQKLRLRLQTESQLSAQMETSKEQNIDNEDQDENKELSNVEYNSSSHTYHGEKQAEKKSSIPLITILRTTVHQQEQTIQWEDKIPSFTILLEAIRADKKKQGYRYASHIEDDAGTLWIHVAASSLDNTKWKGSFEVVGVNSSIKVAMHSGDQSQDYRFEIKISMDEEQPKIKMAAKCQDLSSQCLILQMVSWLPEPVLVGQILGSLEGCHQNSSHEVMLKITEKDQYTVDVEVQVHGKTRYKENACAPYVQLGLQTDQQTRHQIPVLISKIHSTKEFVSWMFINQASEADTIELNLNSTSSTPLRLASFRSK